MPSMRFEIMKYFRSIGFVYMYIYPLYEEKKKYKKTDFGQTKAPREQG